MLIGCERNAVHDQKKEEAPEFLQSCGQITSQESPLPCLHGSTEAAVHGFIQHDCARGTPLPLDTSRLPKLGQCAHDSWYGMSSGP